MAGIYTARHLDDARALFMFRSKTELDYHYRDTPRQKELMREALGSLAEQADRWLAEVDHTHAFYFDSISQLALDIWSRGRVTLVGDAGYCPGPAVGGSTSIAVIGAYILARELIAAGGDHLRAYAAYQQEMADSVSRSRVFARGAARTLLPGSAAGLWAVTRGVQLVSSLPAPFTRILARLNTKGVRLHDSMPVPDYPELEPQ
jgi:2-polyprenyl-6-methoxyphenol hydroxylase-like FAD-dependent oxidoreductase